VVVRSQLPARLLPRVPPYGRPPMVGPWPLRFYEGVPLMSQPKRWLLMILLAWLTSQGVHVFTTKRPMTAAPWSLRSS
jgi:hypothetical protein